MKLYNEDCLIAMDRLIEDGVKVDAIITDPPYQITACKWDKLIPFDLMWEQLNRIIKPNGAIVLFGSEPFSSALRMSNIKNYKYDIVYEKERPSNPALAKKRPLNYIEYIHIFYKSFLTYNPQKTKGKKNNSCGVGVRKRKDSTLSSFKKSYSSSVNDGMKYPKNIIKFSRPTKQYHPTQKPLLLMEYLVRTYTNENELVLDFTMGSGTTGVACKNLNRKFIGIEIDKDYFEIAKKRIEKHTTQERLFKGEMK